MVAARLTEVLPYRAAATISATQCRAAATARSTLAPHRGLVQCVVPTTGFLSLSYANSQVCSRLN